MSPAPDLGLPSDWSRRRILAYGAFAQLVLLLVAVRHVFFWGGEWAEWLHAGEALGLLVAVGFGGAAYAQCLRQATSLPPGWILGAGALVTAIAWLQPPFLSSDVFDYVARGRVEHLGQNPYLVTTAAMAADPATAGAMVGWHERAEWQQSYSPYGPVNSLVAWLCVSFGAATGAGGWGAVYAFKLLCALCHLSAGWLVFLALRQLQGEREAHRGLALWVWNPLLVLECASSGHNDAILAALLASALLGVALASIGRATRAFGTAVLVKHGLLPTGPLLLAHAVLRGKTMSFCLGALAVLGLLALFTWRYFLEPGALQFLVDQPGIRRSSLIAAATELFGHAAGSAVFACGALAVLGVVAAGLRRVAEPAQLAHWCVLAMAAFLLLAMPNFSPWYHLWWLPFVALSRAPVVSRAAELLGWLGPLAYLPYLAFRTFGPAHQVWNYAIAGMWPLLLALLEWRSLAGMQKRVVAEADKPAS